MLGVFFSAFFPRVLSWVPDKGRRYSDVVVLKEFENAGRVVTSVKCILCVTQFLQRRHEAIENPPDPIFWSWLYSNFTQQP